MPGPSATARHSSPWTSTCPSGSSARLRHAVSPTSPAEPGRRGAAAGPGRPAATAKTKMPAVSATTGTITVQETRSRSSGVSNSIIEPSSDRDDPADRQDAVAHDLDLGDQEHDPEQDQEQPRPVDRQALEGEEREDQRDAADHAGQDDARGSRARRRGRACRASSGCRRCSGRVISARKRSRKPISMGLHRRALRVRGSPGPRDVFTCRPSTFSRRSGTLVGDQVDHPELQRLRSVADTLERTAFSAHSALRPRSRATVRMKAAASFSTFLHHLLVHGAAADRAPDARRRCWWPAPWPPRGRRS